MNRAVAPGVTRNANFAMYLLLDGAYSKSGGTNVSLQARVLGG